MEKRRLDQFNAQELANTAWAFATVGQQDEQLFQALARMAERRLDEFNAQELANMAWACATVGQQDEQLFKALARMAERRLDEFKPQGLANAAWAFATVGQKDVQLFKALAKMAERRLEQFNAQGLANTAWAFATVGAPAPVLLDPISVLDVMEAQGCKPQLVCYAMSMQGLATTGQIEAGFSLLEGQRPRTCCPILTMKATRCFTIFSRLAA